MPFFQNAHGRTYYRVWPAEKPVGTVVFLHGYGEHSGHYHRLAACLVARSLTVWALDQRGHGLSDGARGEVPTLEPLVENAREIIAMARKDAPGKLAVIGHSLGGLAAAMAIVRGESCVALGLTGTMLQPAEVIVPAGPTVTADPFYLDLLANDPYAISPTPEVAIARRAAMTKGREEVMAGLSAFTMPVLMINGDRDVIAPHEHAVAAQDILPDAKTIVIPGGYHDIINDVAHFEIERLLTDFVAKHLAA